MGRALQLVMVYNELTNKERMFMPKPSTNADLRQYGRNKTQRVILIIKDAPYLAQDWSPGGFSIQASDLDVKVGDVLEGEIDIFELGDKGRFSAKVVRQEKTGVIALAVEEMSSHIFMNLCITVGDEDVTD
jgi:hypothetical protein